jgi:chaperonin GroES
VIISPLGDVVVIKRSPPAEVSAGGIALAWSEDYREDIGEVVAVGRGRVQHCDCCKTDTTIPLQVSVGDRVLFSTNGHQITTVNGEELVVLREKSIIAVIEGEPHDVSAGNYSADRRYAGVE